MFVHQYHLIVVPTVPRDFTHMDPASSGAKFNVTLTWSRPDPPNGLIIQYNVSNTANNYMNFMNMFIVIGILYCQKLTKS